jgi:hypothetical protein
VSKLGRKTPSQIRHKVLFVIKKLFFLRIHCIGKVIPVDRVVGKKRIIRKKFRAKEEERHKGSIK